MVDFSHIGAPTPRLESEDLVTGSTKFGEDLSLPGLLWGAVLRSPLPHARIKRIATDKARSMVGVKAVVSGSDSPATHYGLHIMDEVVLPSEKVRYIGDEVAAVAAVDVETAQEALKSIEVEYEDLPAVLDPVDALAEGAPVVHEGFPDNIVRTINVGHGDVEKAFGDSAVVLERTFSTSHQWQAAIERFTCTAWWLPSKGLTVWSPVQDPSTTRGTIAKVFGLPESRIRVIQTPVGGSFGSKLFTQKLLYVCVLLALNSRSPVRMTNSIQEEIAAGRPRVPARIRMRLGVRDDGRVIAKEVDILANNGAYTSYATGPFIVMCTRPEALYNIPNVRTVGRLVYTNTVPTGAVRGFGNITMLFAIESMMEEAARRLGIDPIDFRLRNCVRQGDVTELGYRIGSCGLPECLEAVREEVNAWRSEAMTALSPDVKRGIGVACSLHVSSNRTLEFDGSTAMVSLNQDGSVVVNSGDGDVGQGIGTVFALMVAEVLGVGLERVQIAQVDTSSSPHCLGIYADRGTTISANAVKLAAEDLKRQILEEAGAMLGVPPLDLELKDGHVVRNGEEDRLPLRDVLRHSMWKPGGRPLQAIVSYDPETWRLNPAEGYHGNPSTGYTFSALGVEVEVDKETGGVRILRAVSAHDLGKLINPLLAEGQVRGAFAQGLGFATSEQYVLEAGRIVNDSLMDYLVPTSRDMPSRFKAVFVESDERSGPFGAKGLGQTGTLTVAPAIANAVRDAVGVRVTSLPLTREKVWTSVQTETTQLKEAKKMRQDLELLRGAIELHVHSSPDLFPRLVDHVEVARLGKEVGYRAIVLKSQNMGTADRVPFVRMVVPGIDIFGSITLNYSVGGINPFAVNAALGFGAKVIWLPTIDARHHMKFFGGLGGFGSAIKTEKKLPEFYKNAKGLTVLSEDGKLLPEVRDILDLVAANNVLLGFGHLSPEEWFAVAKGCQEAGVKKMMIDHPNIPFTKIPVDTQIQLTQMGVKMNYIAAEISPRFYCISPKELAANIKKLGAKNVVISTDGGQPANPNPIELMRLYVQMLLEEGLSFEEVKTMLHHNPASFIYE